jgi:putative hydrolase of the HAD superfamily
MPQVVSFDIAGTLIDFYYFNYVWEDAIPRLYARKWGVPFDEAKEYVVEAYRRIGRNDIRWYVPEYWFDRFKLDEDPLEIFSLHTNKLRIYPEVVPVLQRLSQRYVLITASSVPRNIQDTILGHLPQCFKHTFSSISDRQEMTKTRAFYLMICHVLRVEAKEILHVGDDWFCDFLTPKSVGIDSVFIDRRGKYEGRSSIRDLRELQNRLDDLVSC